MLVYLSELLVKQYSFFNVVSYLTFRSSMAFLTAFIIALLIGKPVIAYLLKLHFGQVVRDDGPSTHLKKNGTPTMGGVMILFSIIVSVLLWTRLNNTYIWASLFVLSGFGLIGFIDDYKKIVKKNSKGLIARWKYFWMSVIALLVAIFIYINYADTNATVFIVPFFKNITPQLGILFIVLSYFVIVGTGNAVNLTDGLDGLAIMPTILVASGLGFLAWVTGNLEYSNYLNIPHIANTSELLIICASIAGAGLGFLWFNTYPALVFMGDVGSLALGGVLGTIAVLVRQEILLIIMGGIFVIETLSVILQVGSFKLRQRRIFKMAPIHHHYELQGLPETRVIVRFWIVSLLLVLISLVTLKIR